VYVYDQRRKDSAGSVKINAEELFKDVNIADLLSIAEEGQLCWSFSSSANVEAAVEAFSKGIHRALVYEKEGDELKYHIISQKDIVKYFFNSHKQDELFNAKIKDVGYLLDPQAKLETIESHIAAIEGFKKIGRSHFGAVAVVDDKGSVIASLCGTDLRSIDDSLLHSLLRPADFFLKTIHNNTIPQPLTITVDDTLASAVQKIISNNDHRLWIVDANNKLTGVLTLTDVCRAIFTKIEQID